MGEDGLAPVRAVLVEPAPLVGGQESAHSTLHFSELFRLADAAGLLTDPDGAGTRKRGVMTTHGVEA